jgi:heme exporter protein A
MLEARKLSCRRGDRTLFEAVSFCVQPGTLLWVSGANGSGKTTLLRALCGLLTVDCGSIAWCGEDISEIRNRYVRQVAYIGHRNALKEDLNPIENLRSLVGTVSRPIEFGSVQAALNAIGLARPCQLLPTKWLSEGQKRRVALARLWCDCWPLWILDEPFTALDAHSARVLRERLTEHVTTQGLVVLASHEEPAIRADAVHRLSLPE